MTSEAIAQLKHLGGDVSLRQWLRAAIALRDNAPVSTQELRLIFKQVGATKKALENISSTLSGSDEFIRVPDGWELRPQAYEEARKQLGPATSAATARSATAPVKKPVVFFGHGRSTDWRALKDYVVDKLGCEYEEYNREPTAGLNRQERLSTMLARADFACLVMTAEDETKDGKTRARENVVHEVGLFQGKLGFKRAIVLLQHGCEEFSNIAGLDQVRFKDEPMEKAHEIRDVLVRERLIKA